MPEPYVIHTDSAAAYDSSSVAQVRAWQRGRFLTPADSIRVPDLNDWGPFVVPADSLFMLGDNRDASYDSRFYGFVPIAHLFGRPRLVYYSFDPFSYKPLRFLTAIRWSRVGLVVSQ